MADVEKKLTAKINVEDNTKSAFQSLGQNISKVQGSAGGLASGLKTLGAAGAALYAGHELLDFLKESTEKAIEDETATIRLTAAVNKLGFAAQQPVFEDFIDKMRRLGQAESETTTGLTRLLQITGDVNESIYLSKLASDLAASGYNDYASNVEALTQLMLGRGRQAMAAFGVETDKDRTIAEALDLIIQKITISTEDFAATTVGKLKTATTAWDEFKGYVGKGVLSTLNFLTRPFVDAIHDVESLFTDKEVKKAADEAVKAAEEAGKAQAGADARKKASAAEQESTLKSLQDAFKDFSKNVVQAFEDQEKAIGGLRKSLDELDDQLDLSLSKSEERYGEELKNLARRARDRVEKIDEEIEDERASMNAGWRTRIEQLNREKAREQELIDKAAGAGVDTAKAAAQDEFDILKESHEKELKEIKDAAAKKKAEIEDELGQREAFLRTASEKVSQPGFLAGAAAEGATFAGSIGASPSQQVFNFTFNGDVSDVEALKKAVIETLNREAASRNYGGK